MYLRLSLLLFCLVSSSLSAVVLQNIETIPETTTKPPPKTTTQAPKTTTVAPTTTTPPPQTTTVAPTTTSTTVAPTTTSTTIAPTTTTVAPNTTTSTTTTTPTPTTQKPTTTTPSVPTTPAPPATEPSVWYLKDGNVTCVAVKMIANINVTYSVGTNTTKTVLVPVLGSVNGTTITGKCNSTLNESLDIVFGAGHHLLLTFATKDNKFTLASIKLSVNASALPDNQTGTLVYEEKEEKFPTPVTLSYMCNKVQNLNLTSSNNITSVLSVSQLQLQAYRTSTDEKFSQAQDCENMDTPDMVPIAVGVSLGVMIVIVLAAYLIGRRRARDTGYVSIGP